MLRSGPNVEDVENAKAGVTLDGEIAWELSALVACRLRIERSQSISEYPIA